MKITDENIEGAVKYVDKKEMYNLDSNVPASEWVKTKSAGYITYPQFSSALNLKQEGSGKYTNDSFGSLINDQNNVYANPQGVALFSANTAVGHKSSIPIATENFEKCCTLFAARKSVKQNWLNYVDEYIGGR